MNVKIRPRLIILYLLRGKCCLLLISSVVDSVVDPNTFKLDPDPGFWPNLDPDPGFWPNLDLDPDPGLNYKL